MKKHIIFCITLILMITFCIAGCTVSDKPENTKAPENTEAPVKTDEPVKIADHLYEATYKKDTEWKNEISANWLAFGCSAVQNGNFRGRNYDWNYADTDICIVHAEVSEKRPHASVGVADMSFLMNADGTYNYDNLPFAMVDGINDAGLCVQVNVMPFGENGAIPHTDSTEDDIWNANVLRFILDNAASVEEALALIKDKDIHSELGTAEELHWMISGAATKDDKTIKTVVVEIFPDGQHITDKFIDDKPIMTNFNVSNFDGTANTIGIGFGYERWETLKENFDQANSVMGTFDLMEKVYFTKMYDLYIDNFWYSEYNGTDLGKYYDAEALKNLLGEDVYNFYIENYGAVYYNSLLWDGEKALKGDPEKAGIIAPSVKNVAKKYNDQPTDGSLWITIHTSVYDLENKTLDIQVRESQDHLHFTVG